MGKEYTRVICTCICILGTTSKPTWKYKSAPRLPHSRYRSVFTEQRASACCLLGCGKSTKSTNKSTGTGPGRKAQCPEGTSWPERRVFAIGRRGERADKLLSERAIRNQPGKVVQWTFKLDLHAKNVHV